MVSSLTVVTSRRLMSGWSRDTVKAPRLTGIWTSIRKRWASRSISFVKALDLELRLLGLGTLGHGLVSLIRY